MKNLQAIDYLKLILVVFFLICLLDMPYGFFQLVRFVGMVGFGLLAFYEKDNKNRILLVIWTTSAILINPFFKIALGREVWNAIDVVWAIVLLGSIFMDNRNKD